MTKPNLGVQTLLVSAATSELHRVILKNVDGKADRELRRLTCPYAEHRPCSLACAVLGGSSDRDGVVLLWCRAGGNRVILGAPDPERTDLDEMNALISASDFAEQLESES